MRRVQVLGWTLVASLAATAVSGETVAATGAGEAPQIAEARTLGEAADVMLRYIQEDGPASGHVRVVLTPEVRALTVMEARMAAEQAFLQTLKEPGLGDDINRITVVVRLVPDSHPDPDAAEQVVVYQHKSGRDWSVILGD
jgi:hypothetical protein